MQNITLTDVIVFDGNSNTVQKETRSKETVHPTHGFSLQLDVVVLRHTNILIIRHVFVRVSSCASVRVKVSVKWGRDLRVCPRVALRSVRFLLRVRRAPSTLSVRIKIAIPRTDMREICEQ